MADWTLRTPRSWITELSELIAGRTAKPAGSLMIPLTFRQGLLRILTELDTDLNAVAADLAAGLRSVKRQGRQSEYYVLSGTRFDVYVSSQPAVHAYQPLAVVTSVKAHRGLSHRGPRLPAWVDFHPPHAERVCDIAEVHRWVTKGLAYQRALSEAGKEAADLLRGRSAHTDEHGQLHALVRRHFAPLTDVIKLLEQRGETEGARRAEGEVIADNSNAATGASAPAHPDTVCVRLPPRSAEFACGFMLDVSVRTAVPNPDGEPAGGGPWRLAVVGVEDDLLYLDLPAKGRLAPGTAVSLDYEPRFALGRHDYALRSFLREEVEGDWNSLARLLSHPGSLPMPAGGFPDPPALFDRDLNTEQRAAVTGALGTPHALLIQGPPGTGKTTVISEIVRQLTARGERVLLLAPMHVAVDEVLRRVGRADGVLAMRVAGDDSRVRAELRGFTKQNLAQEFAERARRPGTARAPEWNAERAALDGAADLIESCDAARVALDAATEERERTAAGWIAWRTHHRAAVTASTTELTEARTAADRANTRSRLAEEQEAHAAEAFTAAEGGRSRFVLRLLAVFGAGALAEAGRARSDARREVWEAHGVRRAADALLAERRRTAALLAREEAERDGAFRGAWTDADARADVAQRAVALGRARLAADVELAGLDPERLSRRAAENRTRADRLGRLAHLEQRWFQLTGQSDTASDAEGALLLGALGEQLARAANLVCCTTVGFAGDSDVRDADFDTLIVDEASRVIDSEFLIGAKQARRWIMVGDERQLPPYVEATDEHHLHALAAVHMAERGAAPTVPAAVRHLGELWHEDEELHRFRTEPVERIAEHLRDSGLWKSAYRATYQEAYQRLRSRNEDAERELLAMMRRHLVQSLFERCVSEAPALCVRLTEQHRMVDSIAQLVRGPVYGGRYVSPPPTRMKLTPLVTANTFPRPVVFLDTSDDPRAGEDLVGTGFVNALEARSVEAACRIWESELAARGERRVTVSVLTFYKAQAHEIRRRLGAPRYPGFRVLDFQVVDSIDRIQGQESDLVIISFCRTRRGRRRERPGFALWLQDIRRLNVAATRARRAILLIGHRNTLAGLRGVPAAEDFYANMFDLFTPGHPDTILLKRLDQPVTG
ncbi:DEAD/DEAH box helicase [Streptomyces uncialis]|uniref:DEAD/DEAH box helicase n=1 Tax=Streptomyces uncialis TaxID=1048205 RepID=UPI0037A32678